MVWNDGVDSDKCIGEDNALIWGTVMAYNALIWGTALVFAWRDLENLVKISDW